MGSSTLTCCVTLSQLFPNYTPWRSPGSCLVRQASWLRTCQSLRFAGVVQDEVVPMLVGPLLTQSICGREFLPVHCGKLGIGKPLLSGPQVPLLQPGYVIGTVRGGNNPSISGEMNLEELGEGQMKDGAWPPPHPWGSPSKAGITVLRRASTRPSGEPKRKKPETLKSRRAALMEPSGASEVAVGGQEAVLARLGSPEEGAVVGATCRLCGRAAQCCCLHSPAQTRGGGGDGGMGQECHLFWEPSGSGLAMSLGVRWAGRAEGSGLPRPSPSIPSARGSLTGPISGESSSLF